MFSKILIANRGEIACRIIKTARRMGVKTVAVYSDADANALHCKLADEAVHIGQSPATQSYLQMDRIIDAAKTTGAQAVHPGYGFLSENPEFADKLAAAGLVFIGPSAQSIRNMGLKDEAKRLMEIAGVPVVPGYHGANQDPAFLAKQAGEIGYPVLIKARAGGGGKGMRLVDAPKDFATALASAQREGQSSFGDAHVLIEKFIQSPRHIEVQVFGDTHGNVVHLFERDCSMQRRHQKVIEEAPAPNMPDNVRTAMTDAAVTAARQISYHGAGTIEFIVDGSGLLRPDGFWFMEMNTRLQVEHPVTEAVTGQDLVEWQLRVASGEPLPLQQDDITLNGHAVEARIYAEDATQDFKPAPGTLTALAFDSSVRVDSGVVQGDEISPFYDPMIAKLITHSNTRAEAVQSLKAGLQNSICAGTPTNIGFLTRLISDVDFENANLDTGLIERRLQGLSATETIGPFDVFAAVVVGYGLDPSCSQQGWQHWQDPNIQATLESTGGLINLSLVMHTDGSIQVTTDVGSGLLSDIEINNTTVRARLNNTNLGAMVEHTGNVIFVKSGADVHSFAIPDPLDVAAEFAQNNNAILSPMTGLVTVVHKAKGDHVTAGDPVLVVEAMKMEHVLTAPRDGVIEGVFCAASDSVSDGMVLMTLQEVKP